MKIADDVIKNAGKLSGFVSKEKCWLRGEIYSIDTGKLDEELRMLMQDCKQFISEKLSSEMRHVDDGKASQSCEDVGIFSTRLLKSKIDIKLKIALFKELNIFGYMFDRGRSNYRICFRSLDAFLDQVEEFKKGLSESEMTSWNNSSYGGETQVPFFRGYLQGIMAN